MHVYHQVAAIVAALRVRNGGDTVTRVPRCGKLDSQTTAQNTKKRKKTKMLLSLSEAFLNL